MEERSASTPGSCYYTDPTWKSAALSNDNSWYYKSSPLSKNKRGCRMSTEDGRDGRIEQRCSQVPACVRMQNQPCNYSTNYYTQYPVNGSIPHEINTNVGHQHYIQQPNVNGQLGKTPINENTDCIQSCSQSTLCKPYDATKQLHAIPARTPDYGTAYPSNMHHSNSFQYANQSYPWRNPAEHYNASFKSAEFGPNFQQHEDPGFRDSARNGSVWSHQRQQEPQFSQRFGYQSDGKYPWSYGTDWSATQTQPTVDYSSRMAALQRRIAGIDEDIFCRNNGCPNHTLTRYNMPIDTKISGCRKLNLIALQGDRRPTTNTVSSTHLAQKKSAMVYGGNGVAYKEPANTKHIMGENRCDVPLDVMSPHSQVEKVTRLISPIDFTESEKSASMTETYKNQVAQFLPRSACRSKGEFTCESDTSTNWASGAMNLAKKKPPQFQSNTDHKIDGDDSENTEPYAEVSLDVALHDFDDVYESENDNSANENVTPAVQDGRQAPNNQTYSSQENAHIQKQKTQSTMTIASPSLSDEHLPYSSLSKYTSDPFMQPDIQLKTAKHRTNISETTSGTMINSFESHGMSPDSGFNASVTNDTSVPEIPREETSGIEISGLSIHGTHYMLQNDELSVIYDISNPKELSAGVMDSVYEEDMIKGDSYLDEARDVHLIVTGVNINSTSESKTRNNNNQYISDPEEVIESCYNVSANSLPNVELIVQGHKITNALKQTDTPHHKDHKTYQALCECEIALHDGIQESECVMAHPQISMIGLIQDAKDLYKRMILEKRSDGDETHFTSDQCNSLCKAVSQIGIAVHDVLRACNDTRNHSAAVSECCSKNALDDKSRQFVGNSIEMAKLLLAPAVTHQKNISNDLGDLSNIKLDETHKEGDTKLLTSTPLKSVPVSDVNKFNVLSESGSEFSNVDHTVVTDVLQDQITPTKVFRFQEDVHEEVIERDREIDNYKNIHNDIGGMPVMSDNMLYNNVVENNSINNLSDGNKRQSMHKRTGSPRIARKKKKQIHSNSCDAHTTGNLVVSDAAGDAVTGVPIIMKFSKTKQKCYKTAELNHDNSEKVRADVELALDNHKYAKMTPNKYVSRLSGECISGAKPTSRNRRVRRNKKDMITTPSNKHDTDTQNSTAKNNAANLSTAVNDGHSFPRVPISACRVSFFKSADIVRKCRSTGSKTSGVYKGKVQKRTTKKSVKRRLSDSFESPPIGKSRRSTRTRGSSVVHYYEVSKSPEMLSILDRCTERNNHSGGKQFTRKQFELTRNIVTDEVIGPMNRRGFLFTEECFTVLNAVYNFPGSEEFRSEISSEEVPDYYKVVKFPMCLDTIAAKLRQKKYINLEQFVHDMRRIFWNCRLYNERSGLMVLQDCDRVEDMFDKMLSEVFPKDDFTYISGSPKFCVSTEKKRRSKDSGDAPVVLNGEIKKLFG